MRETIVRKVSLARALSKLGFSSRSQAAEIIRDGKVTMNGNVITDPDRRCSLEHDRIAVDGVGVEEKELVYVLMNKPSGYVTTRSDELERKTIYDLLGSIDEWIFPVGRLDKDTSGLLLLTNDHRLGEKLTNPASKIPKTYRVLLDRSLADEHKRMMERGMILDGEQLLPARVRRVEGLSGAWFELIITEGKNRQIRRMCSTLGYEVRELIRVAIGGLQLTGLKPGEWKRLNRNQIALLSIQERS